jgi:uncharacterized protein (TIGR04255 family)
MKYPKNNLNDVIFHIKFSPLSKLCTNEKDAILEFQKEVEKEFPNLEFEKKRKPKYNVDRTGKLGEDRNRKQAAWILSNENKQIRISNGELRLIHDGEKYDTFKAFLKDVNLIVDGLSKYDLENVEFIGLRYINQFEIENENLIDEYFNPSLHLRRDEFSEEEFVESLTKTDLIIEEYDLILTYGRFNPDYPNRSSQKDVVLDYDCIYQYDEESDYIPLNLKKNAQNN